MSPVQGAGDDNREESRNAQAYFEAIEEAFIRWRGAPFLLTPKDWHLVRQWYQEGIPRETIEEGLRDFFSRRREKGKDSKIWGLNQCRRAIENAWQRKRDLESALKSAATDAAMDVPARLQALARSLPDNLPEIDAWRGRIACLEGSPEEVEARLTEFDQALLAQVDDHLDPENRQDLEARLESSLETLAVRLPKEELQRARERMRQQLLRETLRVPLLSLFSPEAENVQS